MNDEEQSTRCWVTIQIAVDVEGEPTDESVRERAVEVIEDVGLDRDHVSWGVESIDDNRVECECCFERFERSKLQGIPGDANAALWCAPCVAEHGQ